MSDVLKIKVVANAKTTEIFDTLDDGTLRVRIHAPRDKGKANTVLLDLLKDTYGGEWEIVSGATTSRKLVRKKSPK